MKVVEQDFLDFARDCKWDASLVAEHDIPELLSCCNSFMDECEKAIVKAKRKKLNLTVLGIPHPSGNEYRGQCLASCGLDFTILLLVTKVLTTNGYRCHVDLGGKDELSIFW